MNCPICKSENNPKNKFCIVCGIKISDADFINSIDFIEGKPETSRSASKSIQISNTVIHGGISLEGTAHGRDESINYKSKSGVKEYINDRIGTQARDSIVHRSDIGAGARKCPNCGAEVQADEKFCTDCRGLLG